MKKIGILGTYLFITLLTIFLASDFSLGYSEYCNQFGYRYSGIGHLADHLSGFDCSTHVNSFLSAFLGNPQTYFFTISILLVILFFFNHTPYLKPEYWIRVANPVRWVVKKILLISLEVTVALFILFIVAGLLLGFSVEWELWLLFYPIFLFIFSAMSITFYHVIYVVTEKYIISLLAFFFMNLIYFTIINEIAWAMIFDYFERDVFITNISISNIIFMLVASSITLVIALKRKECYQ